MFLFSPCILITLCGRSIPRNMWSLHTEQQTEQVSTRVLFFLAEVNKASDSAPNTSCSLRASCACVRVFVGLFKTNRAESHWKSFTGCVPGRACSIRLAPKPLACGQVGTAIVFSLAGVRREFSVHFTRSASSHAPKPPPGAHPPSSDRPSHLRAWDPARSCSLLWSHAHPAHHTILLFHLTFYPDFYLW